MPRGRQIPPALPPVGERLGVHIVQHEAFEAPGALVTWIDHRGHRSGITRLHEGEPLPPYTEDIGLLVVLGGPQSPATTPEDCPHFDIAAERALVLAAITGGSAVVGICLGAQIIGEALGAHFEPSPEPEIGTFSIALTPLGLQDEVVGSLGIDTLNVGHWHNDMPGLTADSAVLATSQGCPRQIVRFAPRVYGLQCHLEFTPAVVELLIEHDGGALSSLSGRPYIHDPATLRRQDYGEMNEHLYSFLDKLVSIRAQP